MEKKSQIWFLKRTVELILSSIVLLTIIGIVAFTLISQNINKKIAEKTASSIVEFVNIYDGTEEKTFALSNYFNRQKIYRKKEKNYALFFFDNSIYIIKESDIEKIPNNKNDENFRKFVNIYEKEDFSFGEDVFFEVETIIYRNNNKRGTISNEKTNYFIIYSNYLEKNHETLQISFLKEEKTKKLILKNKITTYLT